MGKKEKERKKTLPPQRRASSQIPSKTSPHIAPLSLADMCHVTWQSTTFWWKQDCRFRFRHFFCFSCQADSAPTSAATTQSE